MLNSVLNNAMAQYKTSVFGLAISILLAFSLHAQEKNMVQIKAFDQQLNPIGNLSVSVNGKEFISIEEKKATFHEILKEDLPPKSITINKTDLEAESWNYNKGTLEIVIRKKLFTIIEVYVETNDKKPLGNVTVNFKGKKNINVATNAQGNFQLPLALDEVIAGLGQFSIEGYRITKMLPTEKGKTLVAEPVAQKKDAQKNSASSQPSLLADFDLNRLDSIRSLTIFYAVFKNFDMSSLDESVKKRIDAKFLQLVNQLERSGGQSEFQGKISDSSFVVNDVKNLVSQAKFENELLDNARNDFDEKIRIINQKIGGGTANLDASERDQLVADLNILEDVLRQNEDKFYKNISDYRNILGSLKASFSDIQNLENKLSLSETRRLAEQKASRNKIFAAVSVALIFGVLVIFLVLLRTRLKKQQGSLINANNEVKRMNENLEVLVFERTRLLIDAHQEMDIFLYRASHDLRAPICTIIGLCNIALHTNEGTHELIRKVSETAIKMDGMLKKLRMISEINQPSNYSSIFLYDKIKYITGVFSKFIKDSNIDIQIDCDDELSFYSYPDLIEIILYNLIDNALFFSSVRKDHQPKIVVKASIANNTLYLSIHDNGIGIDEQIRIKLWDMFFVGHEYSKGNGLGLYIVFKSIQALKGKIDVQTEPNAYTNFIITIPVNTNETSSLNSARSPALLVQSA